MEYKNVYIPTIPTISMKINITIPDELVKRIKRFREGIMEINISKICAKAIKKELDKLENAIQR